MAKPRALKFALSIVALLLLLAAGALLGAYFYLQSEAFEKRLEARLSDALGRQVTLHEPAAVKLGLPPRIRLSGLRIANPHWAAAPDFLELKTLVLRPQVTRLWQLQVVLDLVRAAHGKVVIGTGPDGASTWPALPAGKPGRVRFGNLGGAHIRDVQLKLAGNSAYLQTLDIKPAANKQLTLDVQGRVRAKPLQARLRLPRLNRVTGGRETLHADIEKLEWGNSDVAGQLTLNRSAQPPMLSGDLHSHAWEVAGSQSAPADKASTHLFPKLPIPTAWRGLIDADVNWRADSFTTAQVSASAVRVHLRIKDNSLFLDPLQFDMNNASANTHLTIDVPTQTPSLAYAGRIQQFDLSQSIGALRSGQGERGFVTTEFDLYGVGDDTRTALTDVSGDLRLVLQQGLVSTALLNRIAVKLGRYMGLTNKVKGATPVRCLAVQAKADHGLITLSQIIMDSAQLVLVGQGTINLHSGELEISLAPTSEGISLGTLDAPIDIRGNLKNPRAELDLSAFAAQTAGDLVTGFLGPSGPMADLIGDTGGKGCRATLREFGRQ